VALLIGTRAEEFSHNGKVDGRGVTAVVVSCANWARSDYATNTTEQIADALAGRPVSVSCSRTADHQVIHSIVNADARWNTRDRMRVVSGLLSPDLIVWRG
jgi:prophage tail gpP-like protein